MRRRDERGAILLITLMALALVGALGAALILASSSETMIAANFRHAAEARYAAEAALERAIGELAGMPVWTDVPAGATLSSFVDGPPSGVRRLPDGTAIDLTASAHMANCHRQTPCSSADLDRPTDERPWGVRNPRWQIFGFGRLPLLTGGQAAGSHLYLVSFVSDDPAENDEDWAHDGLQIGALPNPGRQVLLVRADAFGPRGVHAAIEATIARIDTAATTETPAWSEVRVLARHDAG
jgi:hypothetical protein